MGWSREEWEDFCRRAGIDPARAMRTGIAEMREKSEEKRISKSKESNARRRRETKAHGPIASGIPYALRERDPAVALATPASGTQPQLEDPGRRAAVSVTICGKRLRPLDPDNFIAGCKQLVDGLVQSGILCGDSQKEVNEGEIGIYYQQ